MKTLIVWALSLCLLTTANAATYYFSSVSGNDSYTTLQAQNPSTPWKSINKLNAVFSTLLPGDVILFKRGETFYGTIKVSKSGTATAPFTFGAYGTGIKPLITGFATLDNWTSVGGGKYESYNASLGSAVSVVNFNGNMQEMGRFPNSNADNGGYLNFESHGTNSITDKELTSTTNWTGAELVVRTNRFVIDRTKITSHSSTTLSYSPALSYAPLDGFGYFFQNDIRTLDQLGEWYYNPSTKKMTVYFGSNAPSNYTVQASALNRVVEISSKSYIIFDDLAFSGGNESTIYLYAANDVQVKNCDINFSDDYAIFASNTQRFQALNNTINNTQNVAIILSSGSGGVVKGNKITNTGVLTGMGVNGANKTIAIFESGSSHTIEGNTVDNTGYIGIRFCGNNALIKNNIVSRFNSTKDDGSGIYTNNPAGVTTTGQKIIGNIVMDGTGAAAGTNSPVANYTKGIYLDDRSSNVEVAFNTVTRNNNSGVFIHNSRNINMHDNLLFDNAANQLLMVHDQLLLDYPLRGLNIKNNIFLAKTAAQGIILIKTLDTDISSFGVFDNNTYSRPLDKDGYFITTNTNTATSTVAQVHNLASWQKVYGHDLNSQVSNAYVAPHKLNALIGSNLFTNAGFDANINGLNSYATVSYTRSWVSSKLDKGTFEGKLTSSTPSLYTASTPIGSITAGKKYVVQFTAQSDKDTSMFVYFRKSASPYTCLSNDGTKNMVNISTGRKEYEFVYTPKVSESNAVLLIEVNARNQTIWLDNLKVYEADAVLTNAEDSIKLFYNEEAITKTFALNGSYVDVLGKSYSGSIALEPYTSAVLIQTTSIDNTPVVNQAPLVALTSPTANDTITAPASVRLTATASDSDGTISKVEFYRDSVLIQNVSTAPYEYTWSNVLAGSYTITAKAYDNSGNVTTSAPVTFIVKDSVIITQPTTPVANKAPSVTLTSPTTNTAYTAPASVRLTATATDSDGTISKVVFYNGSNLITTESTAPYDWTWSNVVAGTYTITAKAYDNSGNVTTSTAATITVKAVSTASKTSVNKAPTVTLTSPTANATYMAPAKVRLTATASDVDGTVTKVEFYRGSTLIVTEKTAPYDNYWYNVLAGTYTITAKAYDNNGNVTTSAPVTITVKSTSMALATINGNEVMMSAPASTAGLNIYPNPAVNKIFVAFDASMSTNKKANLMIRNIAGSTVKSMPVTLSGNGVEVDITSLAPGTYILTIAGDSFNKSQKFLKANQ